jgi:hypothetical protein
LVEQLCRLTKEFQQFLTTIHRHIVVELFFSLKCLKTSGKIQISLVSTKKFADTKTPLPLVHESFSMEKQSPAVDTEIY